MRNVPAFDLLAIEGVDAVHDASMAILEEIGIEFRDDEALALWRKAGAEVRASRVNIPRQLTAELLAKAPAEYCHHARNPERSVTIGGRHLAFAPVYGSPYVRDFNGNRRYATLEDLRSFVKLAYVAPALDLSGGTVCEPMDVPIPKRHLAMLDTHIRYSDKPFMGAVTSGERAKDCIDMCNIVFGDGYVERHTVMTSLINCNSPLVWDGTMLAALKIYARHNQAVIVSPFIMQGANTPITTAGALAQLNAEAVAGMAFAQLVRPGAPVVYGNTLSTVSMRSGAPTYGTPETMMLMFAVGQLARRYQVPFRTGGMRNGSKVADAQAAFESLQTMISALFAGVHLVLHAAGWLESGLSASYAKFVLDVDQLIQLKRFAQGLDLSEEALAFEALREVGPGGHYFGCAHTLRHYEDAFYIPESADNRTYEEWAETGADNAETRALRIARSWLDSYVQPSLDPGVSEELANFVDRRMAELPDGVT